MEGIIVLAVVAFYFIFWLTQSAFDESKSDNNHIANNKSEDHLDVSNTKEDRQNIFFKQHDKNLRINRCDNQFHAKEGKLKISNGNIASSKTMNMKMVELDNFEKAEIQEQSVKVILKKIPEKVKIFSIQLLFMNEENTIDESGSREL